MSNWKTRLFLKYLHFQTRPSRIRRYLEHSCRGERPAHPLSPGGRLVRAAALQVELAMQRDPLDYAEEMRRYVEKAAGAGAQLVVFPENNGLQLFGMLPGIPVQENHSNVPADSLDSASVLEILRHVGPVIRRAAVVTFSNLARLYNVHIMAGSFMHPEGSRVVNRAYLFGPAGELLGTQDKVHLFPTELNWGLAKGKDFKVFKTVLGTLAMPICMDATYFETFRILRHLGADIVTVPIANAEPFQEYRALRGIWPRVQESLVFGVKSALVGQFMGMVFTGKAGIYAPLELTENRDGILGESSRPYGSSQVIADLDLDALQALRNHHPYLGDTNPALYRRYFPTVYRANQGDGSHGSSNPI